MVETSQGRSWPAHSIGLAPLIWVVTISVVLIRRPALARRA